MDTWAIGGRVAGLRPICISPVNINYLSTIVRGRVDVLLRPSSTSNINTKMINSTIAREIVAVLLRPRFTSNIVTIIINYVIERGRVAGIKRPMSTSPITRRHFNNFFIINTIIVKMVGGIMAGITRTIP